MFPIICCIVLGYLFGTFNTAYIIGLTKGIDIRAHGSGNAGASNTTTVLGKKFGVICALCDILKAVLAYKLAELLFPTLPIAGILSGAFCIVGHIFPFWMGFKGGKGLASLAGCALAYDWKWFLLLLGCAVIFILIVDYIALLTCAGAIAFPVVYWFTSHNLYCTLLLCAISTVMVFKHSSNFKRILAGQEKKVSSLWKKKQ